MSETVNDIDDPAGAPPRSGPPGTRMLHVVVGAVLGLAVFLFSAVVATLAEWSNVGALIGFDGVPFFVSMDWRGWMVGLLVLCGAVLVLLTLEVWLPSASLAWAFTVTLALALAAASVVTLQSFPRMPGASLAPLEWATQYGAGSMVGYVFLAAGLVRGLRLSSLRARR